MANSFVLMLRRTNLARWSLATGRSCARRLLATGASGSDFDAEQALHSTPRTKAGAVELYDQWAPSYDETLAQWGYQVPARMADIMREHADALARPPAELLLELLLVGVDAAAVARRVRRRQRERRGAEHLEEGLV